MPARTRDQGLGGVLVSLGDPAAARLLRTGILLVSSLGLSVLVHMASGGSLPPLTFLIPVVLPVAVVGYLASARAMGRRAAAAVQVSLQLALHHSFTVLGGHQNADPEQWGAGLGGGLAAGWFQILFQQGPCHYAMVDHPGLSTLSGVVVLVLQVAATVLSVAALDAVERAVVQTWWFLLPWIVLLSPTPWVVARVRRCTAVEVAVHDFALSWIGLRRGRRGPPCAPSLLTSH